MIGTSVDRYKIMEELGHGGMSVVYRGIDVSLEREVAVKVLHDHLARRLDNRKRFHREAKAIAKLHHPNILEVYDFSPEDAERAYIVMEYVPGQNLHQFIKKHDAPPAELAALMMLELCGALDHAHSRGIIHRDLKPENVMLSQDGELKLMDFGIAHVFDQETMTQTGSLLGSPGHMAPEMIEGMRCDERSDIFSLGTVLYWIATGALPFEGKNTPQILKRVLEGEFEAPDDLNPAIGAQLAHIISRCLEQDPAERYPNVEALSEELRAFVLQTLPRDEQRPLLRAYLTHPDDEIEAFLQKLIPRLVKAGKEALEDHEDLQAFDHFNRVLAYRPGHEEVQRLMSNLSRRQRRLHLTIAAVITIALVGLSVMGYESLRQQKARDREAAAAARFEEQRAARQAQRQWQQKAAQTIGLARDSALAKSRRHILEQAELHGASTALHIHEELEAEAEILSRIRSMGINREEAAAIVARRPTRRNDPNNDRRPPRSTTNNSTVSNNTATNNTTNNTTTSLAAVTTAEPEEAREFVYRFRLVPAAAQITIDNRDYSAFQALKGIKLEEGRHQATISSRAAKRQTLILPVNGPQKSIQRVILEWEDGSIEVNTNKKAILYIDDKPQRSITPNKPFTLKVPMGMATKEGRQKVNLSVRSSDELTKKVDRAFVVRAGESKTFQATFQ